MAREQHGSAQHDAAGQGQAHAQPGDLLGAQLLPLAAPPAGAGADGNAQRQRQHVAHGGQVGRNLVAGGRQRALAGDEQGDQGERGHLHPNRQPGRDAQAQKLAQARPVGRFQALPQVQRAVKPLGAHQHHRGDGDGVIDQQRGPGATGGPLRRDAPAAKGKPDGQRHLQHQGPHLNPGDQLRAAQRLVERGVQAKEQRRGQRPADDDEVIAHAFAHCIGHLGQAQQWLGEQQHAHAQHTGGCGQVQRLAKRLPDGRRLAAPVLLGPDRQQCLQHAHERDIDADEHGRGHGQGGQRIGRKAPGHDGVGHAKGHHGQLARQHGHGMAGDDRNIRHRKRPIRDCAVAAPATGRPGWWGAAHCAPAAIALRRRCCWPAIHQGWR